MTTLTPQPSTSSHFFSQKDRIEQAIAHSIVSLGEKNKLRDACEYALTTGGKRFRPLIVLLVAEALGEGLDVVEAALAVEFFHTASLIADDLPCMDNEDERRDKPTVHKIFGETIALLASYALITAAFQKIYVSSTKLREAGSPYSAFADRACSAALEIAARCAGSEGATGGQFLDLFPPLLTLEAVKDVILKKTVTLFEVSFTFGWIFGGGEMQRLSEVRKLAFHFGMAFQVADDIGDLHQDLGKEREMNLAKIIGKERAHLFFQEEMRLVRQYMKSLELSTPSFQKMCDMLMKHAATSSLL